MFFKRLVTGVIESPCRVKAYILYATHTGLGTDDVTQTIPVYYQQQTCVASGNLDTNSYILQRC